MIDSEKFFAYLKEKIPNFEKTQKKGQVLFTCPNITKHKYQAKSPTMTVIPGTDKFYCLQCGVKFTMYDCIRAVEPDKQGLADTQIIEYMTENMQINTYPELDIYKKYGWYLFAIAKNSKVPIKDEHWREKEYNFNEKSKWLKWLESDLNLAVNCEFSNVMIVDFDDKEVTPEFMLLRDEFKKLLDANKTLVQNTPRGGKHFVFIYDEELCFKQKVNLGGGLKIDTRTHKGYFLCAPSRLQNSYYNWVNLGAEIKTVSPELKKKLLEIIGSENKVEEGRTESMAANSSVPPTDYPKLKGNNLEGMCNDTFIRLGGIFINHFTPVDTELILSVFNTQLLEQPMPMSAIKAMTKSLEGYRETEETTQEKQIYECCKLLQVGIHPKDVRDHTKLDIDIVNKHLSAFNKLGVLVRRGRGIYDFKEKVEWINSLPEKSNKYPFKIPYFEDIAYFEQGDILLIGAPTGKGKTHIAMNIIKQMKDQGVKPYYISLESGSRYLKTAGQLGLSVEDFYVSKNPIINPTQIEIEPNSMTIVDWLYTGEDFAMTQAVFKYLCDEMRRKGGILVVFSQLKEDYNYFAVNLIKSFPSLAARYIYDDSTGVIGHFEVDKIRDSKGHYQTARVDCEFSFDTKLLTKKDII